MGPLKTVLVMDNVDDVCGKFLASNGVQVSYGCKLTPAELIQKLKGMDGLIVRSETKVTKEIIEACSGSLKAIGRAGVGLDNIDMKAAISSGIRVFNTPDGNAVSACELTCCFILSIARNVFSSCQAMKEGIWERKLYGGGLELRGKVLAIVGLGRIGLEVAARMKAFGMTLIGFDPLVSDETASIHSIERMELEQIWPIADFLTVHVPLTEGTKNLIDKTVLAKCKKGVRIVNVARGGIVNEIDLLEALESGRCGAAAIDVFTEEPPESSYIWKLISHKNVLVTPHLGASTNEAQTKVALEIAEIFVKFNRE